MTGTAQPRGGQHVVRGGRRVRAAIVSARRTPRGGDRLDDRPRLPLVDLHHRRQHPDQDVAQGRGRERGQLLLRHGVVYTGRTWTVRHEYWLRGQRLPMAGRQMAYDTGVCGDVSRHGRGNRIPATTWLILTRRVLTRPCPRTRNPSYRLTSSVGDSSLQGDVGAEAHRHGSGCGPAGRMEGPHR
jgi:Ni/Co efflux regulator RcnB